MSEVGDSYDRVSDRVNRHQVAMDELNSCCSHGNSEACESCIKELRMKLATAREALEHYAERNNWSAHTGTTHDGIVKDWYWGRSGSDDGFKVATEALAIIDE